jgi:hypothetical protein
MKMGYDDRTAAERMRPGAITSGGFLGGDSRPIVDIIEADEAAARAVGLDFDAAADRLEELARSGEAGLGEPITIGGSWVVRSDEARGKLPCPWHDGIFHKNSVRVELSSTGEALTYSDLSIHLLRAHHFCQGEGSPFRLSPEVLKRVLAL